MEPILAFILAASGIFYAAEGIRNSQRSAQKNMTNSINRSSEGRRSAVPSSIFIIEPTDREELANGK